MAAYGQFPPLNQVTGNHAAIYEAYFQQADTLGTASIGALDAATFLKKSGLQDKILSQIWDLSDPSGHGYLDQAGFFIALKLIALAQNGQDASVSKLTIEAPPPNLGPVETASPSSSPGGSGIPWCIKAGEKSKYDQVFESLLPMNGLLSGDKVRPVLLNSKLPMDMLGRVWELSDIDKDGFLDRDEFAVAMHLVYRALENDPVPLSLPHKMMPPSKRKGAVAPLPGAVSVLPGVNFPAAGRGSPAFRTESPSLGLQASKPWVVTATDKAKYDVTFMQLDTDKDGLVGGEEIKDIFVQSGLPNNVLAHIWELSDVKGTGKLNCEQFALAMYFMQHQLSGIDVPAQLTLEMIPPSLRPKAGDPAAAFGVADGTNAGPYSHVADFSAIKGLDTISQEIDGMKREKLQHEADHTQKEADIRIRNSELQMLQKEFEAITATLQQLENQKKEAQKCLDELDDSKLELEKAVQDMNVKYGEDQKQIDNLKIQIMNQEKSVKDEESALAKLRVTLSSLHDEESQLEQKVEAGKQQLEGLGKSHSDIKIQISQTQTRLQHLQDQHRGVSQGIASYNDKLNGDQYGSHDSSDNFSTRATAGSSPVSTMSNFSSSSGFDEDPFKNKDPFAASSDTQNVDPFQNSDPFKDSDPFKGEGFASDPFASEDPFKDAFTGNGADFLADPLETFDPFAGATPEPTISKAPDPFDPFGGRRSTSALPEKPGSDLFGSDPFAPQAPKGRRSTSPTPALPPKERKKPPPRPAPPRPKSSPSPKPPAPDPFGSPAFGNDPFAGSDPFASSGGDQFANFADFSPSKFTDDNKESLHDFFGPSPSTDVSEPRKTRRMSYGKKKPAPPPPLLVGDIFGNINFTATASKDLTSSGLQLNDAGVLGSHETCDPTSYSKTSQLNDDVFKDNDIFKSFAFGTDSNRNISFDCDGMKPSIMIPMITVTPDTDDIKNIAWRDSGYDNANQSIGFSDTSVFSSVTSSPDNMSSTPSPFTDINISVTPDLQNASQPTMGDELSKISNTSQSFDNVSLSIDTNTSKFGETFTEGFDFSNSPQNNSFDLFSSKEHDESAEKQTHFETLSTNSISVSAACSSNIGQTIETTNCPKVANISGHFTSSHSDPFKDLFGNTEMNNNNRDQAKSNFGLPASPFDDLFSPNIQPTSIKVKTFPDVISSTLNSSNLDCSTPAPLPSLPPKSSNSLDMLKNLVLPRMTLESGDYTDTDREIALALGTNGKYTQETDA